MNKLVESFCDVDDFCKVFIPQWQKQLLEDGTQKRQRSGRMTTSEMMTIVVIFHVSHDRDFKNYSLIYVTHVYKDNFPMTTTHFRQANNNFKGEAGCGFCAGKSGANCGFKRHILIDDKGNMTNFTLTQALGSEREAV